MSNELKTNAELLADKSRDLSNFKNLSLPGVKEQVAEIIALIGRNGIFSTYTLHDISHIDAMLKMLDWLVPDSTRSIMTPVDWLLSVLAIYLHDLGMVTTSEEYANRLANHDFTSWRDGLEKTDEGREYLARTNRMSNEEKEHFFFQEFIRKGHAQRIREWVTGRHSTKWGPQVEPIAHRIDNLLRSTPPRFRDYLGIACESHHKANLDKTDLYPLAMRFGNDPGEIANVQYAAVLLRTTDLLHITKDRTPSVMYQTIRFSDPKSVEEWDKQLGTFSVGPKGRKLVESDPESAVVVINADFTEERPLFALQEYIAYADSEINQSNRWIEKSQESHDGKGYSLPWHKVDGDVRLEGVPPQSMRFELDRGQLLDLLVGHTIYNEPTVAIRELLQNAIDAVRYQAHLAARDAKARSEAAPPMGKVTVNWRPTERLLTIQDDGVGMDRDVIRHHLMSVGSSYYNTSQFETEHRDFVPISRFGIGILTCFMVSDDIEIVTCRERRGHRIRMTSVKSTYLLRELEAGDPLLDGLEPHGTRVRLRLRDTVDLSERNILDIVKYWVILPECTVEYTEPGKDSTKIGFSSTVDALRSYYIKTDTASRFAGNLEFVVKSHQTLSADGAQAGRLELAFGVTRSFFPERLFSNLADAKAPRVCIEGIRVSEQLPGFEKGAGGVGALLAVRGSRRFRTTVSRAGLEVDDEYRKVARTCAEMLFEHVRDESARIASKPGRPLSQAASGAIYLIQTLQLAAPDGPIRSYLGQLADDQPTIVVERVSTQAEKPVTSREIVSPNALRKIPVFWTIESRSVDSLGIISLDLGRELSLNEFLAALAPDVTQLKYSPLIPRAHHSIGAIRAAHSSERVEFSREHQQTAIKWTCGAGNSDLGIDLEKIMPSERLEGLIEVVREQESHERLSLAFGRQMMTLSVDMQTATIVGDDPKINAVTSRMGVVLQKDSALHAIWSTVRNAVLQLASKGTFDEIILAMRCADAFSRSLSPRRDSYQLAPDTWRNSIPRLRTILNGFGIKDDLPADIRDLITAETVFDAVSFWRDWDKPRFDEE